MARTDIVAQRRSIGIIIVIMDVLIVLSLLLDNKTFLIIALLMPAAYFPLNRLLRVVIGWINTQTLKNLKRKGLFW